jgi:hypothetical protein
MSDPMSVKTSITVLRDTDACVCGSELSREGKCLKNKRHKGVAPGAGEVEIEVAIEGTAHDSYAGTFWDPPEAAFAELDDVTVEGKPFELTEKEIERAEKAVMAEADRRLGDQPEYD